jgi:hypothetical protein
VLADHPLRTSLATSDASRFGGRCDGSRTGWLKDSVGSILCITSRIGR